MIFYVLTLKKLTTLGSKSWTYVSYIYFHICTPIPIKKNTGFKHEMFKFYLKNFKFILYIEKFTRCLRFYNNLETHKETDFLLGLRPNTFLSLFLSIMVKTFFCMQILPPIFSGI